MTLKNNRAPLLSNIKLYVSFHHHMWIQTVTVRKRLSWVMTSVTLTFDLWPWPFAWTLPWSLVITSENFMMIWCWEHSQKGVTDRQTDRQTDRRTDRQTDRQTDRRTDRQTENTIHRAAWSQLKIDTWPAIMHIFNEVWCSYTIPSKILTQVTYTKQKLKSDEKNSSYHLDIDGGRTDGWTDGQTDR